MSSDFLKWLHMRQLDDDDDDVVDAVYICAH